MSSAAVFNELINKLSLALNIHNEAIVREESISPIINAEDNSTVSGGVDAAQAIEDVFKGGDINSTTIANSDEVKPAVDADNSTIDDNSAITQAGGEIYEDDKPQLADTITAKVDEAINGEANDEANDANDEEVDDGIIADPYENEESHSNDELEVERILPDDASSMSEVSITNSDDGSSSGDDMFEETLKAVTAYRLQHTSLSGGDISTNSQRRGILTMRGGAVSVTPQSKMLTLINEYPWVVKKN